MKKLLIVILLLLSSLLYADVDTRDGTAIDTSSTIDGNTTPSQVDGATIVSASADVARIGTSTYWTSDQNTGNNAVTVDSAAEMLCYLVGGFSGTADYLTPGTKPRLCDATDCSGTSQDIDMRGDCDGSGTLHQGAIFCLASPNTGSQYIVWDWSGSGTSDEGLNHWVVQYKNVNASQSWQNGCDYTGPTFSIGPLTAVSGDMFVGVADHYAGATCVGYGIVWTGATEINAGNCNNKDYGEIADATCTGNKTVSQVPNDTDYSSLTGVIIQK